VEQCEKFLLYRENEETLVVSFVEGLAAVLSPCS